MSVNKDLYAVLGVLPDAEPEIIRVVYLALAKKYHPDGSTGLGDEEKFKEINEAYQTLSDPTLRQAYDEAHSSSEDSTGEYEPDADEDDLSFDDYDDDWKFATEYRPELTDLLKKVSEISPRLSIIFQSTVLSNKAFNEVEKIADDLIDLYLERYFGGEYSIKNFARVLLKEKRMGAAKELNKAVRIFGDTIKPNDLIFRIQKKFNIISSVVTQNWGASVANGVFVEEYKKHGIFLIEKKYYIVCSAPNIRAIGPMRYDSLLDARRFIDGNSTT